MGEYQALSRLKDSAKDRVVPLLEIPPVGFDFETQQQKKSHDDHLKDFGKRLYSKWQARPCFLDVKYLPCDVRMNGGQHYVDFIFERAIGEGCKPIPVVGFAMDKACISAIRKVQRTVPDGSCLRLRSVDFEQTELVDNVEKLLASVGVGVAETDIILDLATPNFIPTGAYVRLVLSLLEMLPIYNRFRSFTLAAASYPSSVAALGRPFELVPRQEWTGYKAVIRALGERRLPAFGDYAAAHPDLVELDMRLIKPFAKLRYAIDDKWHIAIGTNVRKDGFEQYRDMCELLLSQPYSDKPSFSEADRYIADCAKGAVSTGNLSTWVWISTNRHITKVVADLSKLHGLSKPRA
jgi:hypothetical protein